MSRIIKGYQVQGLPAPSAPTGIVRPDGSALRVVGGIRGRLPRVQVEVADLAAPVGTSQPGRAGQGVYGREAAVTQGSAVLVGAASPAAVPAYGPVLPADLLARAQAKADLLLRQAEERAGIIIDQAVNGAQALVDEARQAGFQEGREEGLKQGREEAEAVRREAEQLKAEALAERDRLFAESREEVVRLALTVARQLVRHEITQDPALILLLVDEALVLVRGEDQAAVRVNPAAAAVVESRREELAARHGLGEVRVVADAGLEPGDVQVQTPGGSVDALVERQMESIGENLTEVVRRG